MSEVAFDCDGTLIHSIETAWHELAAGNFPRVKQPNMDDVTALVNMPREDVVRLLQEFKAAEWTVIVHSGGGETYARQVVRRLKLEKFVDRVETKDWRKQYDICVDDQDCTLGKVNIRV